MSAGIFSNIGSSYFKAAGNTFYFTKQSPLLLKPFAFFLALFYALVLSFISVIFYALIVLDWLGKLTDAIRQALLRFMDDQSWRVDDGLFSFLLRPILLILVCPVFLLSVFIPKLSSSPIGDFASNELSDMFSGAGAFKRINHIIWGASKRLFGYIASSNLLLMPILAIIAIIYSVVLIAVGLVFAILIPLDWLSHIIEVIRQGIDRFVDRQQYKIRYSGVSFIFVPIFLGVLAPVFLALLIVPKFTTYLDVEV